MSRDIRSDADAVYKTVHVRDADTGKTLGFDVAILPDGYYMKVTGKKRYVGPVPWSEAYLAACKFHVDKPRAVWRKR